MSDGRATSSCNLTIQKCDQSRYNFLQVLHAISDEYVSETLSFSPKNLVSNWNSWHDYHSKLRQSGNLGMTMLINRGD